MILAKKEDKALVQEIFKQAFVSNPHMRFLLGEKHWDRKILLLASYVVDIALSRNGLYLSADRQGVLIVFDGAQFELNAKEKRKQLWMALRCFELRHIFQIMRMEKKIKSKRVLGAGDLYVWFYAVSNLGLGGKTARGLLQDLFHLANKQQAAIVAETSIARNRIIYERYGFETYNQIQTGTFPVFFMRKSLAND